VLLIVAYNQNYNDSTVSTWGYILQSLGYTFFLNATCAFYESATNPQASVIPHSAKERKSPAKLVHIVSIVGLVLVITGYTNASGLFPTSTTPADPNAKLNTEVKAGDVIFCALTIILLLLVLSKIGNAADNRSKQIYQFILLALPFMGCRAAYVTYKAFSDHPLNVVLWEKIVFDYVPEVIVVVVYFTMGYIVSRLPISSQTQEEENIEYKPFGGSNGPAPSDGSQSIKHQV
jgi:hypothetical protein